jgi:hypothetical protein
MHSKTSAATTALSVHRTRSKNQPPLRSTHRRRTPRPQLNLKLPADVIDSFRAFCSERGISQRAAIEAALDAFMRGVDHVASCVSEEVKDGRQNQGDNGPAIVGTPCLSVRPDAERRTDTETAADTRADHRGDGSLECRSFGHPVSSGSDSSHLHSRACSRGTRNQHQPLQPTCCDTRAAVYRMRSRLRWRGISADV